MAKILDAKTYSADAVEVVNISLREPISAIYIEAKCLNNGNTPTAHPVKCVPKVEILDGSRVLHSLSGYSIQARSFYGLKQSPFNILNYNNDSYATVPLVIPFGRFLGDPRFALDPLRFPQLQMRITVDIAAGASAADAVILDIDALTFDEKAINPEGFLCAKEYFRYSLTSSAIEDIDLPRDRKIRNLLIHSLYDGKQPYEQYNAFKLTEDNDKRVPFDLKTSHYLKFLGSQYGACKEQITGIVDTSGVKFYVMPAYEVVCPNSTQGGAPQYSAVAAQNGGSLTIDGSAAAIFQGVVEGLAPHSTIILPFGDPNEPDDWYDVSKIGSLKLKITAGSSVGSGSDLAVITEQVEPY